MCADPELTRFGYGTWLTRMGDTIAGGPGTEAGATARRKIHAALVCGTDHTPLEQAWTRYRADPGLDTLLNTIESLTGADLMFPCPGCGYLTMPDAPPDSGDRCPVCLWQDYAEFPNRSPEQIRAWLITSAGSFSPPHRAPRPEEIARGESQPC